MEPVFENRYTVTKERYLDWAKNPIRKNYFYVFWIFVMLVMILLFINSLLSMDSIFSTFYLLLIAFCLYRAFFRTKILASRQYHLVATAQGAHTWERVITLGDTITVVDGNSTSHYQWNQINQILDRPNYLILVFPNHVGIRLDKNGFNPNTYDTFLQHIKTNYPNIINN